MSVTGINNNPKSTNKMKGYFNGDGKNSNFTTYVCVLTEGGKNKADLIQRVEEAKVMFNNKKQLLCSNNLSLEMKAESGTYEKLYLECCCLWIGNMDCRKK